LEEEGPRAVDAAQPHDVGEALPCNHDCR
jgi:hypothetical protein